MVRDENRAVFLNEYSPVLAVGVFFILNRSFLPSTSITPSVRAENSIVDKYNLLRRDAIENIILSTWEKTRKPSVVAAIGEIVRLRGTFMIVHFLCFGPSPVSKPWRNREENIG